uniref:Uncharacterized protein n=1 Tax=Anguilla anguilla TaxID=7936 RepID=A0A0E9SM22_ANGAN
MTVLLMNFVILLGCVDRQSFDMMFLNIPRTHAPGTLLKLLLPCHYFHGTWSKCWGKNM